MHEKKKIKPKPQLPADVDAQQPLIEVRDLKQYFTAEKGQVFKAVDNISFTIRPGETLGLVGESGSGKTTTGRSILQLNTPTDGDILYKGMAVNRLSPKQLKKL